MVNRAPQAVLFDMDGTLLITTQQSDQSWQHVFDQFARTSVFPRSLSTRTVREHHCL